MNGPSFSCDTPRELRSLGRDLPTSPARCAGPDIVRVVAIGSSSTEEDGASSKEASYPSRLDAALAARFPDSEFDVSNARAGGQEVRQNVLTSRAPQPLVSPNRHGRSASEHERFEIARISLVLYVLWPNVVTARLPRRVRRTWRGLGCPDLRSAWTNQAGADQSPPSFLSARISEALAGLRRRAQAAALRRSGCLDPRAS